MKQALRKTYPRNCYALLAAIVLAICCDSLAAAIIEPVSSTPSGRRSDGPFMIGYNFTVGGSNVTINSLGVEDITNSPAPAGYGDGTYNNSIGTRVGIWDSSGTLLGSATVKTVSGSPIVNGFRYEKLSAPITLQAGQTYTIGAQKGGGVDFFSDGSGTANYTAGSGITLGPALYNNGSTFSQPTSAGGFANGRWSGGNATFINSAPEGSASLLSWAGSGSTLSERNNYTGTVGYQFTTGGAITLSSLGFFDHNRDGLATSHRVGIWDATTSTLIAETTVGAGTAGKLIEFFRYSDLASPVRLEANRTYYIATEVNSGGDIWYNDAALFPFLASADPLLGGVVIDRGVFRGGAYGIPNSFDGAQYFFAANFLATPEPGSIAIFACVGAAATFVIWCQSRKSRRGK